MELKHPVFHCFSKPVFKEGKWVKLRTSVTVFHKKVAQFIKAVI